MRQGIRDTGYPRKTSVTYSAKSAKDLDSLPGQRARRGTDHQGFLHPHLRRIIQLLIERIHTMASQSRHLPSSLYMALELDTVSTGLLVHRRPLQSLLVRPQSPRNTRIPNLDVLSLHSRYSRNLPNLQVEKMDIHHPLDTVKPIFPQL